MEKVYRALIKEENGITKSIAYRCNQKDKCNNSKMCGKECKYTFNKEYAVDIGNEKDNQVIETCIYADGELKKKIIEYK